EYELVKDPEDFDRASIAPNQKDRRGRPPLRTGMRRSSPKNSDASETSFWLVLQSGLHCDKVPAIHGLRFAPQHGKMRLPVKQQAPWSGARSPSSASFLPAMPGRA